MLDFKLHPKQLLVRYFFLIFSLSHQQNCLLMLEIPSQSDYCNSIKPMNFYSWIRYTVTSQPKHKNFKDFQKYAETFFFLIKNNEVMIQSYFSNLQWFSSNNWENAVECYVGEEYRILLAGTKKKKKTLKIWFWNAICILTLIFSECETSGRIQFILFVFFSPIQVRNSFWLSNYTCLC